MAIAIRRCRDARLTALVPDGVARARAGRVRGAKLAALLAGADR
jgi:hypothetical protein